MVMTSICKEKCPKGMFIQFTNGLECLNCFTYVQPLVALLFIFMCTFDSKGNNFSKVFFCVCAFSRAAKFPLGARSPLISQAIPHLLASWPAEENIPPNRGCCHEVSPKQ